MNNLQKRITTSAVLIGIVLSCLFISSYTWLLLLTIVSLISLLEIFNLSKKIWKDKLILLDKFEDKRLVEFGKKIIYQEAPEILPSNIFKTIKRSIAKRILSQNREKWWTVATCFTEIDTLRDKYSDENDHEKLKFLDELNEYVMTIQKKYENI